MYRKFILVLAMLNMVACSMASTPEPTATVVPTSTSTHTSEPTLTSTPLPIPAATDSLDPGDMASLVVSEGFSVSVPFPLLHQVKGSVVQAGDPENTMNLSFASDQYDGTTPLMDIIDSFLANLEKRGFRFTKETPINIQIDGVDGIAVNLSGDVSSSPFEGQAVAVSPRADFVLYGLGIARTDSDPDLWKSSGKPTFERMWKSIQFTDVDVSCPVSTDKTYGFEKENPIKVGGGDFGGPSRERAYLDHLLGPNGEALTYNRNGSLDAGDVILDEYHITGSGVDAVIYIDEYNFSTLMAPVGFTCKGAFPLSVP